MTLARIAQPVNTIGFIAVGLVVYFGSIPMAMRVIGLLCVTDAVFVCMSGSTEILSGLGTKHLRGSYAYAFALFAGLLGLALAIFALDLCQAVAGGKPNVCS